MITGPMKSEEVKKRILERFPDALVQVEDLSGNGDHFDIRVACKEFAGKSQVQQHQLVYQALGDAMKAEIHAARIQTIADES